MSLWSVAASRQAELMDDPALAEADHLHALSALARINAISGTAAQLAGAIRHLALSTATVTRPLQVVDVACGGGDVTIALAGRLNRLLSPRGKPTPQPAAIVTGIDMSPRAVARATALAATAGAANVAFEVRDVVANGCPPCDIATSSLFLHHLADDDAAQVLRSLAAAARLGIVISDLLRSRAGLLLAVLGTTVLSSSRVARVDGPLSVRAARTPAEYRRLCAQAGLAAATLRCTWPERGLIEWRRNGANTPAEREHNA